MSQTRHAAAPETVACLGRVARTDPSDPVRRAAVRALGRTDDPGTARTMLALLADPSVRPEARPPGAKLRWEAARVLHGYVRRAAADTTIREEIRRTAIRTLLSDPSRDVRIVAAQILGYFPTIESAGALMEGLRQRDFGVVYASERSLIRLTGKTFDHDPALWKSWFDTVPKPFADRGALDDRLDAPPHKSWWPWNRKGKAPS